MSSSVRPLALSTSDAVDDYRPGGFLLARPASGVLRTSGQVAWVPDPGGAPDRLADRAESVLRGHPVLVGALPFDPATPAALAVPAEVDWSPFLRARGADPAPGGPVWGPARPETPPADYARAVSRAVAELRAGRLDKVVLARTVRSVTTDPVDVRDVLARLAVRDPGASLFAVALPGGRTLAGASPELLVSRQGRLVVSNPLAGSRPRSFDPVADAAAAAELLASAKDRREHAIMVDSIAAALRPLCVRLSVPAEPSLVRTAGMWHLSSRITGEPADPSVTALRLALALHPTPAVCGSPYPAALAAIRALEPVDRGFYAGAVGWCDPSGDGEYVVAIRCCELSGRTLRAYAGAGVVAESSPAAELAETTAKLGTVLGALGIPEVA